MSKNTSLLAPLVALSMFAGLTKAEAQALDDTITVPRTTPSTPDNVLGNDSALLTGTSYAVTEYSIAGGASNVAAGTATVIAGVGTFNLSSTGAVSFDALPGFAGDLPDITYVVQALNGELVTFDTASDTFTIIAESGSSTDGGTSNLNAIAIVDVNTPHALEGIAQTGFNQGWAPGWTTDGYTYDDDPSLGFIRPPNTNFSTDQTDPDEGATVFTGVGFTNNVAGTWTARTVLAIPDLTNLSNFEISGVVYSDDSAQITIGANPALTVLTNDWWADPVAFGPISAGTLVSNANNNMDVLVGNNGGITGLVLKGKIEADETGSATLKITVTSVIEAAAEADRDVTFDGTNDTSAGNVLGAGDTLNGVAADPTPGTGNVELTLTSAQGGLTLDLTTGEITVPAGTAPGSYDVVYVITDPVSGETETATETVVVGALVTAAAEADRDVTFDGTNDTSAGNVLGAGDTLNGVAADPTPGTGNVELTLTSAQGGLTLDLTTGEITVPAGTAPGSYDVVYVITDPVSGETETATETVVVGALVTAAAEADRDVTFDGTNDTSAGNVLGAGDTLNGVAADPTPGTGNVTLVDLGTGTGSSVLTLDPATGEITVAANTAPGTYTMIYQITDPVSGETATATETVVVGALVTAAAEADRDVTFDGTNDTSAGNVLGAGDTLNGVAADPTPGTGNVTLVDLGTGTGSSVLTLDPATGEITVAANTAPGTYTMIYQITDPVSGETATATETVVVGALVTAAAEADRDVTFDGTNDTSAGNVLGAGDTLNGVAADPTPGTGNVTLVDLGTGTGASVLTLDPATGEITVAANTAPGTYTLIYQITDPVSGETATATETVVVGATPIDAVDDAPASVNPSVGGDAGNVLTGDTLSNDPATLASVVITAPVAADYTDADGNPVTGLTLDPATGIVAVAPGTTDGTYTVAYEICEAVNLNNCASATMTVLVASNPPIASNDVMEASAPGPVSIDPMSNDDPAGEPLDPESVVLTGTGAPVGSVLSSDGKTLTVQGEGEWSVNPDTGLVTFTPEAGFSGSPTPAAYTVSDVLGRTSNEAVLSVMVVAAVEIVATNDGPFSIDGVTGGTSTGSVLDNDTLDGTPITDPSLITLTAVSVPTLTSGSIALNPDGTVTVAPGTTPGTYSVFYEICETSNPTNCAAAQVEVVVIDTGTGLINEIVDDLETILEEDFANTLTMQSAQISGYSADALDRLRGRGHDRCLAEVNARLAVSNILFDTDKAIIKPESDRTLDDIAVILASCPASSFEIAGHTDSDASDAYNIDLSQRRVVAVRQALAQRGVDTSGYIARGYGESQPIASNATEAGKSQNRRVEFRPLDELNGYQGPCDNSFTLLRDFNASANEDGVSADGAVLRDQHDCITDRREVLEGSLSYTDTAQGQTQSAINLSYRREQYRGSDSVFGYFVGAYGTQSDVTRLADGEIRGFGLNAGIYGANSLDGDLYLDYYLGAAAGRHEFNLGFARDIGTIDATGDYQYVAGFAGAALSGEAEFGDTTLTPRIGFDYVYSPGADVDVVAELSGLSEVGGLELDAISGGRVFAEVRMDHPVESGEANLWFYPRVACYQSLGSLDGVCGFGGSVGVQSIDEDSDLTYSFEVDGEWGQDYSLGSFKASVGRQIGLGTFNGEVTRNTKGSAILGGIYEIKF